MRRIVTSLLLVLATVTLAPLHTAAADDPGPIVILGPPPLGPGADAMIRSDDSLVFVGDALRSAGQRIDQSIQKSGRVVSFVRICSDSLSGRMRVHGTSGSRRFRVKYLVGRHDITPRVLAGTYRTRWLGDGGCAREIRVVVRWRHGGISDERTFRVRATPRSGDRDVVATRVTIAAS